MASCSTQVHPAAGRCDRVGCVFVVGRKIHRAARFVRAWMLGYHRDATFYRRIRRVEYEVDHNTFVESVALRTDWGW